MPSVVPPGVRRAPEKLQRAAVFAQQHSANCSGELGRDPGVRHVADIVRRAHVAPDDLGPKPPALRLRQVKRRREQSKGVSTPTQGDEGVDVAQLVRRVVAGEAGRGDRRERAGRRDRRSARSVPPEGRLRPGRARRRSRSRSGRRPRDRPIRGSGCLSISAASCGSSAPVWRRTPRLALFAPAAVSCRRSRARGIRNCARRSRRNSRPSSCRTACCSPRG